MIEYWITIQIQVEAKDGEEAVEMGKEFRKAIEANETWKTISVEITKIEEIG
jgi:hypothetical protein